jgi:hypothetical protein
MESILQIDHPFYDYRSKGDAMKKQAKKYQRLQDAQTVDELLSCYLDEIRASLKKRYYHLKDDDGKKSLIFLESVSAMITKILIDHGYDENAIHAIIIQTPEYQKCKRIKKHILLNWIVLRVRDKTIKEFMLKLKRKGQIYR